MSEKVEAKLRIDSSPECKIRAAFPALFKKADNDFGDGEGKFEGTFLIPKGSKTAKLCIDAMLGVATAKWKDKGRAILQELIAADKVCFRDGDKQKYDGFAGNHSLKASNQSRPTVIDRNKAPLTAEDGRPYSGCYVNVIISFWAQDNKYGKRINATLQGVQFYEHGQAFSGGGTASADEFGAVEGENVLTGDPESMFT